MTIVSSLSPSDRKIAFDSFFFNIKFIGVALVSTDVHYNLTSIYSLV